MGEKLSLSTTTLKIDKLEEQRHTTLDFPFHMCQDFWFSDGNVILTAGPFAFKVHRGQLERHAEIFQTMLSIPQPENADCIINLCDSPTDVYHLLRALYDGLYATKRLTIQLSFPVTCWTDCFAAAAALRTVSHMQIFPPAVRTRFPVPLLGPPPILQILHLHPTPTMLGTPTELFPHDARRVGPPRTLVARG